MARWGLPSLGWIDPVVVVRAGNVTHSGTVHDHPGDGATSAFPARSVIEEAKLTVQLAGSAMDVRSVGTIVAVVPSSLSDVVAGAAFPPTVKLTAPDAVNDAGRMASENATVIGARRTTLVAPVAGVVAVTVGAVWSTLIVIDDEMTDRPFAIV